MALMRGRDFVTPDDIKALVVDAIAHRLILRIEDVMKQTDERKIVKEIVDSVTVPKDYQPG